MDFGNLCMGCMSDRGTERVCPICGFSEGSPPASAFGLPVRTVINRRYLIGKVLGEGGFGITYLAWDMNLNIKLAIKEYMPSEIVTREKGNVNVTVYSEKMRSQFMYGLNKFIEEAKTLVKFNNYPGIVSIRDYFKANGTAYIVMAYIEGVNLEAYIRKKGNVIPYTTAFNIMIHVTDALREVHKTGKLHRDVSPENIYITEDGQVKLLDFGAARYMAGAVSRSLTVILKLGYAPPEQYFSKGRQGPWTDVYSAAATMYRAITGAKPPEAMARLEKDTLLPPSQTGCRIPRKSEEALMKALSLNIESRYQTVHEFQQALIEAYASDGKKEERLEEKKEEGKGKDGIYPREAVIMLAFAAAIEVPGIILFAFGRLAPALILTGLGLALAAAGAVKLKHENRTGQGAGPGGKPQKQRLLKCISGYLKGNEIRLGKDNLVFGRDASVCNIVFPADASGISRKHCRLFYDHALGKYVLTDYSRFGTYLDTGEKLEPGSDYRLDPGTRFYLYDKSNLFEVG